MTLSAIDTNVKSNIEFDSFPSMTAAMVTNWINLAQRWVCKGSLLLPNGVLLEHNFSFLETEAQASTVNEQRRYDLPPSTGSILEWKADKNIELIDYQNYRHPLDKLLKKDIEDKSEFAYLLGKGIPTHFCIEQEDIWLYKLPNHSVNNGQAFTINMEYYGYLATLVNSADYNILTEEHPEVIEWKASALALRWAKDDTAQYYDGLAKERLGEMIAEDKMKKTIGLERGMAPIDGQQLGV